MRHHPPTLVSFQTQHTSHSEQSVEVDASTRRVWSFVARPHSVWPFPRTTWRAPPSRPESPIRAAYFEVYFQSSWQFFTNWVTHLFSASVACTDSSLDASTVSSRCICRSVAASICFDPHFVKNLFLTTKFTPCARVRDQRRRCELGRRDSSPSHSAHLTSIRSSTGHLLHTNFRTPYTQSLIATFTGAPIASKRFQSKLHPRLQQCWQYLSSQAGQHARQLWRAVLPHDSIIPLAILCHKPVAYDKLRVGTRWVQHDLVLHGDTQGVEIVSPPYYRYRGLSYCRGMCAAAPELSEKATWSFETVWGGRGTAITAADDDLLREGT